MWDLPTTRNLGTSPSERRRYRRKNLFSKQIGIHFSSGNRGVITDLSEGGMSVQTDLPLDDSTGKFFQVGITDDTRRIEASCQLAWTKISGLAGLQFIVLSDGSQGLIKEWLGHATEAPKAVASMTSAVPLLAALSGLTSPEVVTGNDPAPLHEVAALEREIAEPDVSYERALDLIAELAHLLTKADGAAIALKAGDGEMICRATTGIAPDIGVRLNSSVGLSGECVRTGLMVRSNDTESDPRVDADACRRLTVRSIAIVPLFAQGAASGILEVLSHRPHAFDNGHLVTLPRIGELITRLAPKNTLNIPKADSALATSAAQMPGMRAPERTTDGPPAATPNPAASTTSMAQSSDKVHSSPAHDSVLKMFSATQSGRDVRVTSEHPFPYVNTTSQPDGGQNRVRINPNDPRRFTIKG